MMFTIRKCMGRRFNSQWQQLAHCYDKMPEKLPLILKSESSKQQTIRCGVVLPQMGSGSSSEFLSALLADVYTKDRAWFKTLIARYDRKNISKIWMKYGQLFDLQNHGGTLMLTLPSPFLKQHDVEFLEFREAVEQKPEQECHIYVDLSRMNSPSWPTIHINDSTKSSALPISNTINSRLALKAIIAFMRDKSNVNQFLKDMETSNLDNISKNLGAVLDDKELIFKNLKKCVLQNIEERENLSYKMENLQGRRQLMKKEIDDWSQIAHMELQTVINPLIIRFISRQLSIWKIYTYSESKLRLNLIELLTEPLNNLKMRRLLYTLSGKLQVDDTIPLKSPSEIPSIDKRVWTLHKRINRAIYRNFFSLQLPLSLCSLIGVLSEQFSVFSMGSLASLGIILGFRRVLSEWEQTLKLASLEITNDVRENIDKDKILLMKHCKDRFMKEENNLNQKLHLIDALNKE